MRPGPRSTWTSNCCFCPWAIFCNALTSLTGVLFAEIIISPGLKPARHPALVSDAPTTCTPITLP